MNDGQMISLRLSSADLSLLERLQDKTYGGEAAFGWGRGWCYGRSDRSKVLRQALRDAAEKEGVA